MAPGGRSVHLALQAADADRRHKQGGRADAQRGCKSQFDIIKSQFLNITRLEIENCSGLLYGRGLVGILEVFVGLLVELQEPAVDVDVSHLVGSLLDSKSGRNSTVSSGI